MAFSLDSKILITGGTGFVGSHLVEELLHRGYSQVYVTSFSGKGDYVGELLDNDHILKADLSNRDETLDLFESIQPEVIFHLASIAVVGDSFEKAAQIFQNNISLQLNVLDAIKTHVPTAKTLVIGSGAEYGVIPQPKFNTSNQELTISEDFPLNPANPYAVSKVTQDLLALSYVYSYDLDIVRARPFNHIGERQTTDFAVPAFAQQIINIERGKQHSIQVGNLDSIRDFTDVKDVVKAYIRLLEKGTKGEVYNVGSGQGYSMREILDKMCSYSSATIQIEIDQNRVRPLDVPVAIADNTKLKTLGWKPVIAIEQTLERILDEWRNK